MRNGNTTGVNWFAMESVCNQTWLTLSAGEQDDGVRYFESRNGQVMPNGRFNWNWWLAGDTVGMIDAKSRGRSVYNCLFQRRCRAELATPTPTPTPDADNDGNVVRKNSLRELFIPNASLGFACCCCCCSRCCHRHRAPRILSSFFFFQRNRN